MILIADSGSTKTDWAVVSAGAMLVRVQTKGMNPFFQTSDELSTELRDALVPALPQGDIEAVFFYGAGCTPEQSPAVAAVLREVLAVQGRVEVSSDMLGAARALCGRQAGIACILGTGSNSCLYDGEGIVSTVSPLGFILGDEGSGAVLGKLLVGDLLKNQLGEELRSAFLQQYNLTPADIIARVYRQPFPNRFLASFSPFIAQHINHPQIRSLVKLSFLAFLRRNVLQYPNCHQLPIHFTGSIAHHYREVLAESVAACGLHLGRIVASPLQGLVGYYG